MKQKAEVILYTRPGCHLCEEAKRQMDAADCADSYDLKEINIESDPELLKSYGWDIPVIVIDGEVAFKHRVKPREFAKAVRRERS
jgi:glutaredoxin